MAQTLWRCVLRASFLYGPDDCSCYVARCGFSSVCVKAYLHGTNFNRKALNLMKPFALVRRLFDLINVDC